MNANSHRGQRADDGQVLASRSAQALIFGAGLVTVMNTELSPLRGVNVSVLRMTGFVTMAVSFVVTGLPWASRPRFAVYSVIVTAMVALVVTDHWHHYSRSDAALAVYPVFFILIIAWAGLTQSPGTATVAACVSGASLAWLLYDGGHSSAAVQCVVVTVPAAAALGEVVSWAYGRAVRLGQLDAKRSGALDALVASTSRLQGALTPAESETILLETATIIFAGHDTRFETAAPTIDDGLAHDDIRYDLSTRELRIDLRGQSGILGIVTTVVDQPDAFLLDAARLYSHHVGTRLEQLRMIDALTDAATHDALTGIGNRRAVQNSIDTLTPGDAVFMLDLDHFKAINDSLGHQSGDQVLAQFGEYLHKTTRPTDTVARYGGEEFVLICRDVSPETTELIANRLLDGWRSQRPLVTVSIGFAIRTEHDTADLTVEHADMALYQAKRQGRDQAHGYTGLTTDTPAEPKPQEPVRPR